MIRTRFAPSPNGALHLGHAYAAIMAHDRARADGGEFVLRIEDIDGVRSKEEHIWQCLKDLRWLGLKWKGEPVFQSTRLIAYAMAAERLKTMGLLYPCTCSRSDIAAIATARGPDGPIYPGTCRGHSADWHDDVAWRLDMAKAAELAGRLVWQDEQAGEQIATPEIFGDIVLLRRDAPASYHLAATLDDAADGATVITRGADLFAASHIHRLLQALLDLPVPVWHHHGLLVTSDGMKLAKRRGSPSLANLQSAGEDGKALAAALRAGKFPAGLRLSDGLDPSL